MIDQKAFKKISIFIAIGILVVLSIFIIWPIASSIILGLILAYAFYPVYKKILSFVKEKNTSAIILILIVFFLILIPTWFLFPFLMKQIFEAYLFFQKLNILNFLKVVFPSLSKFSQDFATAFNSFLSGAASKIFSSASSMILNLPALALKLVIVFFVFFFGMRDAETLMKYTKSISPFSKSTEKQFGKKFQDITKAIIYGCVVIGIVQGLFTGLGLFIFKIPNALLLTIFAIIASMAPAVIGAWLIWIPASIYLIVSGKLVSGIILFLYGALFISWIDNFIRPYLVAKKTKIPSVIIIIGMIGGLIVFGALGIVIGPLILVYLLLILDAYRNKKILGLFS